MAKNYQPVIFNNSRGEVVSNDPVYKAQQLLANMEAESDDMPGEYEGMSGAELKQLAKERGVDISGLRKVSEVRAALEAADEAAEGEAGEPEADDEAEADD